MLNYAIHRQFAYLLDEIGNHQSEHSQEYAGLPLSHNCLRGGYSLLGCALHYFILRAFGHIAVSIGNDFIRRRQIGAERVGVHRSIGRHRHSRSWHHSGRVKLAHAGEEYGLKHIKLNAVHQHPVHLIDFYIFPVFLKGSRLEVGKPASRVNRFKTGHCERINRD